MQKKVIRKKEQWWSGAIKGTAVFIVMALTLTAAFSFVLLKEILSMKWVGHISLIILLISSYIGTRTSIKAQWAENPWLNMIMLPAYLAILGLTGMLAFGGKMSNLPEIALSVMAGTMLPIFHSGRKGNMKRKKTKLRYR